MNSKSFIWPTPFKPGDKAAITAPASPVSAAYLDIAVNSIRFLGLTPVVMESCRQRHGYLAGDDRQRAADLGDAFSNPDIKGIFCIRGGFGAARLLPLLDFGQIQKNPKPFVGYSDITALHLAFNQKCGFVTFHGPMPNTNYITMDPFSLVSLRRYLFHDPPETIVSNPPGETLQVLYPGKASGPAAGGNLSLLLSTLGSPWEIDTRGKILFIEEVDELPYRLDKSLTALALAGKFRDCAGIVLCTFADCESSAADSEENLTLAEIFREIILPYQKPTLLNFRAGHIYPQNTIPMGAAAFFDTEYPIIRFTRSPAV